VVAEYVDGIVLRHPEKGAARRAADASRVPVINAGDGAGEHPTQALLDLFTIQEELGGIDHLRVGLAGDLRHGRTVRSLALLLAHFPGTELVLIAPPELQLEADVRGQLREAGVMLRDEADLGRVIGELDVLYQTRIQRERFASPAAYERVRGIYVVDPAMMRRLPAGAILMHPLPRLDEIAPAVDADPRAAYFRQARNGLPVRMAILDWLLGGA
jgi:aspartate carbamoyltransferase catalytic subunit